MAPAWTDLLERNRTYSESKHQPKPFISEPDFGLPTVFIFSCIDIRVPVEQILSLKPEDAFIARNLGGRVKSSLHALLYLDVFAVSQGGGFKDVVIIHHTDCGCTHATDDIIKSALKQQAPEAAAEADQLAFGTYDGSSIEKHEETLRADLQLFKSSPFVRPELKESVRGYLYDIKTGKLSAVAV
ncbi:carbonic anhydrase [Thozetella sp. PMI_491]|nr:carbonic anhydrase [Thozetella sp. PMI_491]